MTRRQLIGAVAAALRPPTSVILILADDLGYGDLGCYGSTTGATPNLDRLAAEGARLTQHYSCSPVCSPARAGLLTGLVPDRAGVTGVLRDPDDERGLDLKLPTLADRLRRRGYETALIGKWHLGMAEPYWPRRRGFDSFWGFLSGTIDYETHVSRGGGATGRRVLYDNDKPIEAEGYFPELMAERAVEFLSQPRQRPFFLYYSSPMPHTPLQAPGRWVAPFRGPGVTDQQAVYRGMVRCLDDGIGRMRAALESTGQWDRTAVIFVSDHGWVKKQAPRDAGDNGPFQGGKYELLEGGIRIPCIVRWPGVTRAGSVIDAVSWLPDWFPTLAGGKTRDAVDLGPVLAGRPARERELCWRFEDRLVKTPLSLAIRRARWKLLRVGGEERLFDVAADPGETRDLLDANTLAANTDIAKDLRKRLAAWERTLPPLRP